ncbi:hypothetical protein CPB86DRAFT_819951 [Serendipita vermifera]|nr:hypothetical protein CPB86DRAFT_819951 [Serendipita vermifera]
MFPSMLVYQVGRYILQGPSKIEFTVVSPSIVEERKAATLRMQARTSRVLKGSKSSSALEGNKKLARLGAANKGGQKLLEEILSAEEQVNRIAEGKQQQGSTHLYQDSSKPDTRTPAAKAATRAVSKAASGVAANAGKNPGRRTAHTWILACERTPWNASNRHKR